MCSVTVASWGEGLYKPVTNCVAVLCKNSLRSQQSRENKGGGRRGTGTSSVYKQSWRTAVNCIHLSTPQSIHLGFFFWPFVHLFFATLSKITVTYTHIITQIILPTLSKTRRKALCEHVGFFHCFKNIFTVDYWLRWRLHSYLLFLYGSWSLSTTNGLVKGLVGINSLVLLYSWLNFKLWPGDLNIIGLLLDSYRKWNLSCFRNTCQKCNFIFFHFPHLLTERFWFYVPAGTVSKQTVTGKHTPINQNDIYLRWHKGPLILKLFILSLPELLDEIFPLFDDIHSDLQRGLLLLPKSFDQVLYGFHRFSVNVIQQLLLELLQPRPQLQRDIVLGFLHHGVFTVCCKMFTSV